MIIICENCHSEYEVQDKNFAEDGRNVRCASCGHVWFQKSLKDSIFDKIQESVADIEAPSKESNKSTSEGNVFSFEENVPDASVSPASILAQIDSELSKDKVIPEHPSIPEFEDVEALARRIQQEVENKEDDKNSVETPTAVEVEHEEHKHHANMSEIADKTKEVLKKICPFGIFCYVREHWHWKAHPFHLHPITFGIFTFLILCCLTFGSSILLKDDLVNEYPEFAYFYNRIGVIVRAPGEGLKINNLKVARVETSGTYSILIKGKIENMLQSEAVFPKMQIMLKDKDNAALRTWQPTPIGDIIAGGKDHPFEISFPNIPDEGILVELSIVH